MTSPTPEQDDPIVSRLTELAELAANPAGDSLVGWPEEIDGYKIVDQLAWGGQGTTLLAYDCRLKRHVVLKLYYNAKTPEQRESLLAEGRALIKVESPFVARCYAAQQYGDCPYFALVLEYCDGTTLEGLGRCSPERARKVISSLASGLEAIHNSGLVHGDIRPSNIMVDSQGNPRFIDFGLASVLGSDRGSSCGSKFTAPEIARREANPDLRAADIFALGGILYFLMTGRAPFEAETKDGTRRLAEANDYRPDRTTHTRLRCK